MRPSIFLVTGLCLSGSSADAQIDKLGSEFILGGGTASATIMCRACTHNGNMGGSTLTAQFLERASDHVRIGGTADWWWHERDTWIRGIWDLKGVVVRLGREHRLSARQRHPVCPRVETPGHMARDRHHVPHTQVKR